MDDCVLTTIDNPWNPFTHPREWLAFDTAHGYNTNRWVAFFSRDSSRFDDEFRDKEIEYAMNKVLEINPFGLHMKVYKKEADTLIPIANKVYHESA